MSTKPTPARKGQSKLPRAKKVTAVQLFRAGLKVRHRFDGYDDKSRFVGPSPSQKVGWSGVAEYVNRLLGLQREGGK